MNYYETINVRFTSGTVTSAPARKRDQHWMHNLSDQVWLSLAEAEFRVPKIKSRGHRPHIRAFTDNLTVTTTSVLGNRWILQDLERLITWVWIASSQKNKGLWF